MEAIIDIEIQGEPESDELYAYYEALHGFVALIFTESQLRVPVRTGRLMGSGRVEGDEDWRLIIYDCPYASVVELGRGMPGEKGYFPGRRYLDGAIEDNLDRFEIFLKLALHESFDVEEGG